jgi:hypothetical protein
MGDATQAAVAWVHRRRCNTPPAVLWAEPDTRLGALLFAGLLWQSRITPAGLPGYEQGSPDTYEALARARDLVGSDPVVA